MEHGQKIEFYKKRQFGDKLNMVIVFLRQNAWPFIKCQIFISGPLLLIINLLVTQTTQELFDFDSWFDNPEELFSNMADIYGLAFLNSIVTVTLMSTVTYSYMRAYQEKGPGAVNVSDITSLFGRKVAMVFGYTLMMMIVSIIGLFFFIIPGVYLWVTLSLGVAIIIFEDLDIFSAFGRTFKLIKEKWLSTFGLIVVTYIISALISSLFSLPYSIALGIWTFNSIDSSGNIDFSDAPAYMQIVNVLFAILTTFGTLISYSVIYLAIGFQYFNLVERQESRGLMAQINQMDNEDQNSDDQDESY